jgi:RHS repeat-associated protein
MRFSSKPWVGFAGSATSGLYYYGYRFYDPYLQRWVAIPEKPEDIEIFPALPLPKR